MNTIIDSLRNILGSPQFTEVVNGETTVVYENVFEYFVSALILCIVVSSVFKFIRLLVK